MKKGQFFCWFIVCLLIFQPFNAIASVWLPKTLSYDNAPEIDGSIDIVTYFTYYDDCFTETVKTDVDNNGIIDEAGYYTYDHPGKIGRLDRDTNYDGTIDEYSIAYGGGGMGELFFRDHYSERGFDAILRGEDYDGNGNLTSVTECTSFDANGYCLQEETDDGPDGVVDGINYHTFNANNKIIKLERDDGADGTIDRIHHYAYHENGNIMKEEMFAYDESDAGVKVESVFTWIFDNKGNPVTMNSTIETVMLPFSESTTTNDCEWVNTYDSNGNLVEAIDECQNETTIVGPTGDIQTITSTIQQAMYLEWVRCDGGGTIDPVVPGDLNDSGEIDLADVVLIMKILAGDESVEIVNNFDISGDERIGLEEALFLLREISKP